MIIEEIIKNRVEGTIRFYKNREEEINAKILLEACLEMLEVYTSADRVCNKIFRLESVLSNYKDLVIHKELLFYNKFISNYLKNAGDENAEFISKKVSWNFKVASGMIDLSREVK